MSETAGIGPTVRSASPTVHNASPTVHNASPTAQNAREAYSFACMNCGYGWEQAFEIEHHVDTFGRPYVTYLADGTKVPSPLTHPTCGNCDGHHVRIMTSGRVAGVAAVRPVRRHPGPVVPRTHHRSLLHFLHRRHGHEGEAGTTA